MPDYISAMISPIRDMSYRGAPFIFKVVGFNRVIDDYTSKFIRK